MRSDKVFFLVRGSLRAGIITVVRECDWDG